VAKKRPWSKEFQPRTPEGVQINVTNVPARLRQRFAAKCKREGKSQRNLLLGWMSNWVEGRRPDEPGPGVVGPIRKNTKNGVDARG
jgi:hypothetical protein